MAHKIESFSTPELTFDVDSPEGKEGLKEIAGTYELDARTWLPFAADTYRISPKLSDYILVVTIICPSDTPNRNGIAFPLAELKKFQPPPVSRMVYKAWTGVPVHLEHDNEDCTRAHGVVLDSSLHKIHGYGNGKLWKVMGLVAIDKTKYPDIAQKVAGGDINTYSMGAEAGYFTCSYCGTRMNERGHSCSHVDFRNPVDWRVVNDYDGTQHLAFRNAHDLVPIELSIVEDPAWVAALSSKMLPSIDGIKYTPK